MDSANNRQPLVLTDTKFVDLMMKRVFNVLIVANPYDAFMLEDDGRVDEKIFDEYSKLGLRYPPRFFQVSSLEEAEAELERYTFELVICMPGTGSTDVFDIAREIKSKTRKCPSSSSHHSAMVSPNVWRTRIFPYSSMCSAGWVILSFSCPSSSSLRIR